MAHQEDERDAYLEESVRAFGPVTGRVESWTRDRAVSANRPRETRDKAENTSTWKSTGINHPRAQGHIDEDGKFRCVCGARGIANTVRNISSHISHMHSNKSTRAQKREEDHRICSLCSKDCASFLHFEAHIRQVHKFRGSTAKIWTDWKATTEGDKIDIPAGRLSAN
ncbi:hypothetical protein F4818DRAFT_444381 [Hypoxylon cercidicola]|nr:hypothetical protein F4818DRAFT_444381 [Hypoxylon cercidicola]